MTTILPTDHRVLHVTLDDIIDRHGLWPVLRAMALRRFRRDRRVLPLGLNAHLRRDIGLPPLDDDGPPRDPLR